ncbi:hypothetical protein TWF281_003120 [Arthrobotrys megalospora]
MPNTKASILLLPTELQTQILSYLPCLDQIHCMGICPLWCIILQKENLKHVRYYDHIYPTPHRLTFEEDVEIDLRVIEGHIEKASIWKRPPEYKKKPAYLLAHIDFNSEHPSILTEALFREDFSGFAPDKINKINVCLIEVLLCVVSLDYDSTAPTASWKRQWILSESLDIGFESMTIAKFLEFIKELVATNECLGTESLVMVKFLVAGWKRRRLGAVISIKERTTVRI